MKDGLQQGLSIPTTPWCLLERFNKHQGQGSAPEQVSTTGWDLGRTHLFSSIRGTTVIWGKSG